MPFPPSLFQGRMLNVSLRRRLLTLAFSPVVLIPLRRHRFQVPDLYRPNGIYSYGRWGVNWRPFVALLFSVVRFQLSFLLSTSCFSFAELYPFRLNSASQHPRSRFQAQLTCSHLLGNAALLLFRLVELVSSTFASSPNSRPS